LRNFWQRKLCYFLWSKTRVKVNQLEEIKLVTGHFCRILTLHFDIIKSFIYSPTEALIICLKNNDEVYIKIYIKTASVLQLHHHYGAH